jgi:hypothetical protein
MMKFEGGGQGTVVNIYCDHCGERLLDIEMSCVVFSYETGEYSFAHKVGCHDALEESLRGKESYTPWWEMDFFLTQLSMAFDDDDIKKRITIS